MRDHFKSEHFLCEEDDCLEEEFTAVFRSEIDLRAHKATVHSKTMSRMEARQARMLEIDFSYGPRGRGGGGANENSRGNRIRTNDSQREFDIPEPQIVQQPPIQIDTKNEEHFPSLAGPSGNPSVHLANSIRHVVYGQSGLARTQQNFPSLGGVKNNEKGNKAQPKQNTNANPSRSAPTASSLFKESGNSSRKQQKTQPLASSNAPKNTAFKKDSVADFPSLGPSSSKTSFFAENPKPQASQNSSFDKRPSTSNAPKSVAPKKPSNTNDFPSLGSSSTKRDLMEDLVLPANSIDKNIVANKHRGLVNDYVSVASQMTKVSLVKQKDEAANSDANKMQNVPKLNSTNNFPSLGSTGNDSSLKSSPQWITVNSNKTTASNQQKVTSKTNNQKKEVPQKNQKSNGTKKANNNQENKKATNEKKIAKDNESSKENYSLLEHVIPSNNIKSPPPGFKEIKPITNSYLPMPDANKRNQALVEEFQKVLKSHESMQEFRVLSQMFRDGNYFARSYYESCKGVLSEKFDTIFPELLVLLPDIEKQQVSNTF